jgi:hypothetical protein
MKKIPPFLYLFILLLLFISCKKVTNTHTNLKANVNASNDMILSVSSYTTIFNRIIKARLDTSLAHSGNAFFDGAIVTYDSTLNEYLFAFGPACPDSVLRSGSIRVRVTGDLLQKGACAKAYFENYYEDSGKIDGSDSITNMGINSEGLMVFSMNITRGTINKVYGGGTISVEINSTFKGVVSSLISGSDLVFLLSGNISGISSKGHGFSGVIRRTLQDSFNCPWITSGVIDMNVPESEMPNGYIDFISGDGCSDLIWYYFSNSSFMVHKNKNFLKN